MWRFVRSRFNAFRLLSKYRWKEALVSTTTMEKCLEVSPEVAKV